MSRTDAHAPLNVRLARRDLAAEPFHAHGCRGDCDLPAVPGGAWRDSRCRWIFVFTGTYICSCHMCHGGPQNRAERRRDRHQARAELSRLRYDRDAW